MFLSELKKRKSGLIGYTGFVGGSLTRQAGFADLFNSATISEISGQQYGLLVCAAAPGSMFEANKTPERDAEKIQGLIAQLSQVKAERFILISSIAVLKDFAGGDDESTGAFQEKLAYGRHRRWLEEFVEERFENSLIVRLPALFGPGLRKNFIFDLLNPVPTMVTVDKYQELENGVGSGLAPILPRIYSPDQVTGMLKIDRAVLNDAPERAALEEAVQELTLSATQFHNPQTSYQYYDMACLWSDIEIALAATLSHIHLVSEPLQAARIHQRLTGRPMPETGARLHREDMRTRHGALWNSSGPYLRDAASTLDRLAAFFASERAVQ